MAQEESKMNETRVLAANGEAVETSRLQDYIGDELADLSSDIVVYNVLQCPRGAI
jgi:hypothetical protein